MTRNLTPAADLALRLIAVALMLAGLVMLFTGPGAGIAIPLIAVGAAITAICEVDKRRGRTGCPGRPVGHGRHINP